MIKNPASRSGQSPPPFFVVPRLAATGITSAPSERPLSR